MRAVGVQNFAYCLLFLQLGKSGLRELQLFSVDNIHLIIIARGNRGLLLLIQIRHNLVGLGHHLVIGFDSSLWRSALVLLPAVFLICFSEGVIEILDRLWGFVRGNSEGGQRIVIPASVSVAFVTML